MAQANLVQKKVQMGHKDIVKYQLLTHCFVNDVQLSNNELDCVTLLGMQKEYSLSEFCNIAVEEKVFKTAQTVRNFLTKAQKLNLVDKTSGNKKKIFLQPELNIQTSGNIVLDFKMFHLVTKE